MERGLHHEMHGAGEPLLLLHGTGSSLRVWDPVVDRLAARRSVIAVDLPGFGASPPLTPSGPPPSPAGFAVVLADLLRRLGHDTAHVAGNSGSRKFAGAALLTYLKLGSKPHAERRDTWTTEMSWSKKASGSWSTFGPWGQAKGLTKSSCKD